jgi:mono/diheme cytochrome c family protein
MWIAAGAAAFAVVLVASGAAWNAADPRSPAGLEAMEARGAALYTRHCASCHGVNLDGAARGGTMSAPPLVKPGFRFFFAALPVGMEGFVRGEIAGGENGMPSFAETLGESEIAALAYYVRVRNAPRD